MHWCGEGIVEGPQGLGAMHRRPVYELWKAARVASHLAFQGVNEIPVIETLLGNVGSRGDEIHGCTDCCGTGQQRWAFLTQILEEGIPAQGYPDCIERAGGGGKALDDPGNFITVAGVVGTREQIINAATATKIDKTTAPATVLERGAKRQGVMSAAATPEAVE